MSSPRLGAGTSAPLEEGGVGLGDGFGRVGGADGGELGDDLAGEWGVDGESAAGYAAGDAELGEDGFDFVLDGHGWLVVSVEGVGGGWQTGRYPLPG